MTAKVYCIVTYPEQSFGLDFQGYCLAGCTANRTAEWSCDNQCKDITTYELYWLLLQPTSASWAMQHSSSHRNWMTMEMISLIYAFLALLWLFFFPAVEKRRAEAIFNDSKWGLFKLEKLLIIVISVKTLQALFLALKSLFSSLLSNECVLVLYAYEKILLR